MQPVPSFQLPVLLPLANPSAGGQSGTKPSFGSAQWRPLGFVPAIVPALSAIMLPSVKPGLWKFQTRLDSQCSRLRLKIQFIFFSWNRIQTSGRRTCRQRRRNKSFDRGGPVWPPRSNVTNGRLGGVWEGFAPPQPKTGGTGGQSPPAKIFRKNEKKKFLVFLDRLFYFDLVQHCSLN